MGQYFSLKELCSSQTATSRSIDNTPPPQIESSIQKLIEQLLDPIRRLWGKPITINSGYRSLALNKAVGGASRSQHTKGEAADITTGSKKTNSKLFEMIASSNLEFDQLIDEKGYQWIHISYADNNRKQIMHIP